MRARPGLARRALLLVSFALAARATRARAQSIETIVGGGSNGRLATSAALTPTGLAVSSSGDVFVSDPPSQRIYRIDHTTGTIATYAGSGIPGYAGDGGAATRA